MKVPGLSHGTLCRKLQRFQFEVCQAERNRCDSTGNPWAFVFSFRTESIFASRQRSYVPTPPPHCGTIAGYFSLLAPFFRKRPSIFWSTRFVIWPNPGTISTHHFEPELGWKGETLAGIKVAKQKNFSSAYQCVYIFTYTYSVYMYVCPIAYLYIDFTCVCV